MMMLFFLTIAVGKYPDRDGDGGGDDDDDATSFLMTNVGTLTRS